MPDDIVLEPSARFLSHPSDGCRIAISKHPETLGGHRIRLSFDDTVVNILRRGLSFPRLHIDGTMANGLRVWCAEEGGMAPVQRNGTGWSVTLPVRRLRGREETVPTMPVPISWERDEVGPVLLVPRLPDAMLPPKILDKLPNSAVDHETIMARADQRLERELGKLYRNRAVHGSPSSRADPELVPEPDPDPPPPIEPSTEIAVVLEPPSATALDLREALDMVNEIADQLGDAVVLSIDDRGRVHAKRRIISFVDL